MSSPDVLPATLTITPWADPVIDALGHDPRSAYVEQFWLGVLGPSTTWLLRRLATGLERHPDGFELPLVETARSLGLGTKGGRHSPFMRSLGRCAQFGAAQFCGSAGLAVRRKLPPLNRHQVDRLPPELQEAHREWQEQELRVPTVEAERRRARRLAITLYELGDDLEHAERQLHRWRFHPAMAREAALWARDRHLAATAAARAPSEPVGPPAPERPGGAERPGSPEPDLPRDLGGDAA